jgi:hypothetical protein
LKLLILNIYLRAQFERKQADDLEPIQTSGVVTDEVLNKFYIFK